MTYYIFVEDEKINGCGQCRCGNGTIINVEVSEEVYNSFREDTDRYIWNGTEIIENPDYEEVVLERERIAQNEQLKIQIEELDKKRIRAICEPSEKEPGLTWLEYYNQQIAELRSQMN